LVTPANFCGSSPSPSCRAEEPFPLISHGSFLPFFAASEGPRNPAARDASPFHHVQIIFSPPRLARNWFGPPLHLLLFVTVLNVTKPPPFAIFAVTQQGNPPTLSPFIPPYRDSPFFRPAPVEKVVPAATSAPFQFRNYPAFPFSPTLVFPSFPR